MNFSIGAQIKMNPNPLNIAQELNIDLVQTYLFDPKEFKVSEFEMDERCSQLRDMPVVVHGAYIINVASTDNRKRIPSRNRLVKELKAANKINAEGLVVHGGSSEDKNVGWENWAKAFKQVAEQKEQNNVGLWVENSARHSGGSVFSLIDRDLAGLWDQIGSFDNAGICLDTAHAFAAGEGLDSIVNRLIKITGEGALKLVHLNNSASDFGSERDLHANLLNGQIDSELLLHIANQALKLGASIILETPMDRIEEDLDFLKSGLD